MLCRRLFYRRKLIARTLTCIFMYIVFRICDNLFFTRSNLVNDLFVSEFDIGANLQTINNHGQCEAFKSVNESSHSTFYTYDLPDITKYETVSKKHFVEYKIPAKDESVAYEANLGPVEVLLIPFSHVDPGYGQTMESYYNRKTKRTLDNMVKKMEQYQDFTFQWAETVFLERWWRDISKETKQKVRALIQDGRLEILSGGWVMPDEAITHYSPVIDQLIEGHQWLWENLGVKPRNNWANDPFGYSSTFPYLWKKSGMENMVILRIHQGIKSTLIENQALEFVWKPLWSTNTTNDILCHMLPYRGYWIGDTCGPYNQHICRQYAFMHTASVDDVVFINDKNVAERARILYEQYRITADLFKRNALNLYSSDSEYSKKLFLPMFLGEDFSFVYERDYDLIYTNYKMLFKYINAKTEWKMKIKFGTVNEYFTKIKSNQEKRSQVDGSNFPSISGDFFPYSDIQDDYWTGYFSTRPFNKQMSRELQNLMKMADIFHTYAYAQSKANIIPYEKFDMVTSLLRDSRRALGMFLHHDGITGTSVLPVIQDFQTKIATALVNTKNAMKHITAQILTRGRVNGLEVFSQTTVRKSAKSIPRDKTFECATLMMNAGSMLTVINPTPRWRTDVANVVVKTKDKYLFVSSSDDKNITFQAEDVEKGVTQRILFPVKIPPFGITSYRFESFQEGKPMKTFHEDSLSSVEKQMLEKLDNSDLRLKNGHLTVSFSEKTGFPNMIQLNDKIATSVHFETEILAYRSKRSGAYIFSPDGDAVPYIQDKPDIKIIRGIVLSEIKAIYKEFSLSTKLYHVDGIKGAGIHISVNFDMSIGRNTKDKEIILRIKSDIENANKFFTDQNGFQMIGRKNRPDRATEENYYPITTLMLLEDRSRRLAFHVAQPHGAASLKPGWIEVMLDRRVSRDDNKGLGQGVMDNVLSVADFVLQLEGKIPENDETEEIRYTYPTESNNIMNEMLNEPTFMLFSEKFSPFREIGYNLEFLEFKPLKHSMPCDVSVVGLRTLSKTNLKYNGTSLVLHRKSRHCSFDVNPECSNGGHDVNLKSLFPGVSMKHAEETSLTHLHNISEISDVHDLRPISNELRSFLINI
ncbi:Alpha-mannosidase 2 [Mactra antiquata]